MTKPYMVLTCIISGPSNPKALIYVYLDPLIDDLISCGVVFGRMMFQGSKIS